MTEDNILKMLQTGDFTIAFHDNDYCCLYKGRYKYDELPEKEDVAFDMNVDREGYAPYVMSLLVAALNGKIESI